MNRMIAGGPARGWKWTASGLLVSGMFGTFFGGWDVTARAADQGQAVAVA
ncbi:MAG: hypothetical protein RLZZ622_732, partial [Planctomycetota bacterium]